MKLWIASQRLIENETSLKFNYKRLIAAETEEEASSVELWNFIKSRYTLIAPVQIEYIGEAKEGTKFGVILSRDLNRVLQKK
jgi:hypothetical protein